MSICVCIYIYELRGNRRDGRTEMRSDRRGRNTLSHRFPPRFFLLSPSGTSGSSTSEQSGQSRPLWGLNFGWGGWGGGGPCTSCRRSARSAPAGLGITAWKNSGLCPVSATTTASYSMITVQQPGLAGPGRTQSPGSPLTTRGKGGGCGNCRTLALRSAAPRWRHQRLGWASVAA